MIAFFFVATALLTGSEAAANYVVPDPEPLMTAENLAKMEQDEVLLLKSDTATNGESVAGTGLAMALINAPVDAVWGYLIDYASQPEYMPRILTAESYPVEGDETGIKQTVKVAWKTIVYHIRQTVDEEKHLLRWRLDHEKENNIAETVGSWQLLPHEEEKTIAVYSLNVDSGMRIPKFLENYLMRRDLPGLIEALKLRAESGGTYKK